MFLTTIVLVKEKLTVAMEVRQGSVFKPIGNSLARYGLLTDASDHLRDVDEGTCQR